MTNINTTNFEGSDSKFKMYNPWVIAIFFPQTFFEIVLHQHDFVTVIKHQIRIVATAAGFHYEILLFILTNIKIHYEISRMEIDGIFSVSYAVACACILLFMFVNCLCFKRSTSSFVNIMLLILSINVYMKNIKFYWIQFTCISFLSFC